MGEEFFTEVRGPIPFGGLESRDPLAFKVYEPDRLVLGKRDGGPPPAGRLLLALVRVAGHGHVRGRDAGPAVAGAGRRRDGRGPHEDGRRVRVLREARHALVLLPRPRRRPGGRELRDVPRQPGRARRRRPRLPGAHRRPPPVGHGQPVHAPALPGRRRDQPRPRGVRLRRGPGQAHARGHAAARRRELRPVGRPRGLRHAAQHGPPARGRAARPVPAPGRRAQAQDRLRGASS